MQENFVETGYIILPHLADGQKREEYVASCYVKQTFAVQTNKGAYIPYAYCLEQVVQYLKFPETEDELGSQVILNYLKAEKVWVIIGILAKFGLSDFRTESILSFTKTSSKEGETSLGMLGDLVWAQLKLFVQNIKGKAAKLFISAAGNEESIINLNSTGWILIKGKEGIKLINKEKEIRLDEEAITISFNTKQNLQFKENILVYKDTKNTLTLEKDKGLDYKLGDDINFKIDEKQCLFTNGTQKFIIKSDGYNLGNINFEKFITKILDFLNQNAQLLTPTGPSSVGFQTGPAAAPKLQQLIQEIGQIDS